MISFKQHITEKIKATISHNPEEMGSDIKSDDKGGIAEIPMNKIISTFEGDDKATGSKESIANVNKIKQGIKKGNKIEPIIVRKYKGGYQVLDGHHRYQAHKELGKTYIRAKIVRKENVKELDKPEDFK